MKISRLINSMTIIGFLLFTNCNSDDEQEVFQNCNASVTIDQNLYNSVLSANSSITNISITGNCMTITFGASGCDPSNWTSNLIDESTVTSSAPFQRQLKFELVNNEACLAFFQHSFSFDISDLQISQSNSLQLVFDGYNATVDYNY